MKNLFQKNKVRFFLEAMLQVVSPKLASFLSTNDVEKVDRCSRRQVRKTSGMDARMSQLNIQLIIVPDLS